MRIPLLVFTAFVALSCNTKCVGTINPLVPDPSAVIPSPPLDACAEEAARLKVLGCAEWSETYADDCNARDRKIATDKMTPADHACVIKSDSCAATRACQ